MRSLFRILPLLVAASSIWTGISKVDASLIVALTQNNQLLQFDSSTPGSTSAAVSITGIGAGFRLVGIDTRPANNQLYGLAVNSNNAISRLYTLDRSTGVAVLASTLSTNISGGSFGVDFNPVADRLRVVSDTGQNYRINVTTGETFTDTNLAYANTDPNAGAIPGVVGSAYTNSFAGATTTALYGIDAQTQSLVLQNPNAGILTTIGSLNTLVVPEASFEIDSTNQAFAVLNGNEFSSINLTTGLATYIGDINAPANVIGITSITAVPEPASIVLLSTFAATGIAIRFRNRKMIQPSQA